MLPKILCHQQFILPKNVYYQKFYATKNLHFQKIYTADKFLHFPLLVYRSSNSQVLSILLLETRKKKKLREVAKNFKPLSTKSMHYCS